MAHSNFSTAPPEVAPKTYRPSLFDLPHDATCACADNLLRFGSIRPFLPTRTPITLGWR